MIAHYTFRNVARMEWIKLRTLRSVRWTLLFALAGMVGIGIAAGFNTKNPNGDVTNNILVGGALGSVLFAVLGVLVMTSEYSSGTIRATLAAEGRTVFVSSHLIAEMALTAERLIVIGAGRLLADTTVAELSASNASLEDAFLALTSTSAEFRAAGSS